MEQKTLNISEETLRNLSVEQLAELKVEVDDLLQEINELIEKCNEELDA